jgi:hypothetical protein
MEQKVKLMASGTVAKLNKTYILPGEKMTASASAKYQHRKTNRNLSGDALWL